MDLNLPSENDPRRAAVRAWLEEHPRPSGAELAEAGYVAPHWPRPWGLDADPMHQLIIDDELRRARVRRPDNPIGIGWAGPTLVHAGTEDQKQRFLPGLLAGTEIWCQLFSEPGAGSDLANLSTRAVRDGDTYVVTGQKVWTSMAHFARYGILLARTDPEAPKHRGISYLVMPMQSDGIEIRPIVEMTGAAVFNEVFMDEVRVPAANLVGEENGGWALARITLANERVSLSTGGALWGMGPTAADLLTLAQGRGDLDPRLRERLVKVHVEGEILKWLNLRSITQAVQGRPPGPEASVKKIVADEHGQTLMNLAKDLTGPGGMRADVGPLGDRPEAWHWGFLFSRALTIGGGTGEVLRNLVGERTLGLPREADPEAGAAWAQSRGSLSETAGRP